MADTNVITDAVDKFEQLPTGGKVAVVAITAGVAVVGIVIANKRAAAASGTSSTATSGTSSGVSLNGGTPYDPTQLFSGSGLLGTPGTTDSVTANGPTTPAAASNSTAATVTPVATPTQTGGIPLPAAAGTAGMSNNFHVISVGSATNLKTLNDVAKYAGGGTWNSSTVFNYRNNSQIFQALGMTPNNGGAAIPASSVQISI